MNTSSKQWFVIIKEWENDLFQASIQQAVYLAIKSYCSNGKRDYPISFRDIARRSKVSIGWIRKIVEQLIGLKMVVVVGEASRVGGTVPIYRIKSSPDEHLEQNKVFTQQTVSVHPQDESVQSSASNSVQSKNINKVKKTNFIFSQKTDSQTTSLLNRKGEAQSSFARAGLDHDQLWNIAQEASDNFLKRKGAHNA